eukprot:GHRR01035542.1.p1 GENE.GHRR01035542.1~~GHRR01035542.1.p1  ORF type:complete len:108 (+),score=30.23 GHRR01035542.1:216-539(+)
MLCFRNMAPVTAHACFNRAPFCLETTSAVTLTQCCCVLLHLQIHGGAGVSQDVVLGHLFAAARTLRIADGPDEVHLGTLAKLELEAAAGGAAALRQIMAGALPSPKM